MGDEATTGTTPVLSATEKAKQLMYSGKDLPDNLNALDQVFSNIEGENPPNDEDEDLGDDEIEDQDPADLDDDDEDLEDSDEDTDEDADSLPNIEEVMADGKKIKVDFTDRDKLKKAIQLAASRNKEKKAKDQALTDLAKKDTELTELKTKSDTRDAMLTRIQEAKSSGVDAIMKLFFGKTIEGIQQEQASLEDLSEEGRANLKLTQELNSLKEVVDSLKSENTKTLEDTKEAATKTAIGNAKANISTAFYKYSFQGKVGASDDAQELDSIMFERVTNSFHDKDTSDMTLESIDKAFRRERAKLKRLTSAQTKTRVAKTLDKKKKDALKSVQSKSSRGKGKPTDRQQFEKLRKAGRWSDIILNPSLKKFFDKL